MDLSSPSSLLLIIIIAIIMFVMVNRKKKIKVLRKENTRLKYEVSNQSLKNKLRKGKDEEKEYKKTHGGGNW